MKTRPGLLFIAIGCLLLPGLQSQAQDAVSLYESAVGMLNKGSTAEQLFEQLDRCLEQDSTFEDAYFLKAYIYYRLQEFDAAIAVYDRLLNLDPYNPEALKRRALTRIQVYDFEGAIADHDRRLALDPTNPVIYFDRAYCKGLNQDVLGSIEDYTKALELDPWFKEAWVNRGHAKMNIMAYSENPPEFITMESACKDIGQAGSLGDSTAARVYAERCPSANNQK